MRGLRYILTVALLLPTLCFAQWSVDLPLADMPTNGTPIDTYSRYTVDMLKAVGERAEATYHGTITGSVWTVVGNTMQYLPNQVYNEYYVMPPDEDAFNLTYVHPQALGNSLYHYLGWSLYTDGSLTNIDTLALYTNETHTTSKLYVPQHITRDEVVYTNYTTVTNYSTLIYERLDGATVTNLQLVGTYTIDGEFVTNTVYDAIYTNLYPSYGTNITGPAYMLLNRRQVDGSIHPGSSITYYTDILQEPYTNTEEVTYPIYTQVTNEVEDDIVPMHLWDVKSRQYVPVQGLLSYTSYYFTVDGLRTGDVVEAGVKLTLDRKTVAASSSLTTLTPYVKVGIDDAALDPMLMPYISSLILQCAPYYIDTAIVPSYASTSSWTYAWLDSESMRPQAQYGAGTNGWALNPVKTLTAYTPETLLTHSGAGTNIMRYAVSVNTNTYPDATDPAWYTLSSGDVVADVPGWQVGVYTVQTVTASFSVWTNAVITNLGFNAFPPHTMKVPLAQFKTQPLSEDAVTFAGFTRHFWYNTNDTNTATYEGNVYAPQDWIEGLNGLTFTNAGNAWGDYDYYTQEGRSEAIIAWQGGWVIVDDFATGLATVVAWEGLFGTNITRAIDGFHKLGYPTKADNRRTGWPTLNYTNNPVNRYPSGYYFPGGTVRPTKYTVGLVYTDNQCIEEAYTENGHAQAQPYWLNRIPLEYLRDWDKTYVTVTTKAPGATTVVEPIDIPLNYRYFFVDSRDVTVGLTRDGYPDNRLYESDDFTIDSLDVVQEIDRAIIDVYDTGYSGSIATSFVVDADAVWVSASNQIVDTYYVAGVTAVTNIEWTANTNIVDGLPATNVLHTTNVTYRPVLTATNEILAHEPASCVSLITVSLATSNTVAVFDTTISQYGGSGYDDFIAYTPDAVDARYTAINALKSISAPVDIEYDLTSYAANSGWQTNVIVGTARRALDGGATNTVVSTNATGFGAVDTDVLAPLKVYTSTNTDAEMLWSVNMGGRWATPYELGLYNFVATDGALPQPDYTGGSYRDPPSYSGVQQWLYPEIDFEGAPTPATPPAWFDPPNSAEYVAYISTATATIESRSWIDLDWTSYKPIDYAEWSTNLVVTATKPAWLEGTVELYMYVDYTAADITLATLNSNSVEYVRPPWHPSYTLPYSAYYWTSPYPDDFPSGWRLAGPAIGNWAPPWIGDPMVEYNPEYVSATNIFTTVNRALTIPSHTYYPLDNYLTPYVLTSYVTNSAPIGLASATLIFNLPTSTPVISAPALLPSVQVVTNLPDVDVDVIDYWEYYSAFPSSYWTNYGPYEYWEPIDGQHFIATNDAFYNIVESDLTFDMSYETYTPLPYQYETLNIEALFSPEFVYHD